MFAEAKTTPLVRLRTAPPVPEASMPPLLLPPTWNWRRELLVVEPTQRTTPPPVIVRLLLPLDAAPKLLLAPPLASEVTSSTPPVTVTVPVKLFAAEARRHVPAPDLTIETAKPGVSPIDAASELLAVDVPASVRVRVELAPAMPKAPVALN